MIREFNSSYSFKSEITPATGIQCVMLHEYSQLEYVDKDGNCNRECILVCVEQGTPQHLPVMQVLTVLYRSDLL